MATVVARPPHFGPTPTPTPSASSSSLKISQINSVPVPNKHLQALSPGLPPAASPPTPPASPPSKAPRVQTSSILYPPVSHPLLYSTPPIYSINADQLANALDHLAAQPLPEPKQVFPWLHGLHVDNHVQLAFFVARRRSLRKTPRSLRTLLIVKAGGDLSQSKLKGAVAPHELLGDRGDLDAGFLEVDPREGFSVRNFQIQVGKMATVSDIVVYGDEMTSVEEVHRLAKQMANAQAASRSHEASQEHDRHLFNTFILTTPFGALERQHARLIAIDAKGHSPGDTMDFFQSERREMCAMSCASEISRNVWLGPTPDALLGDGSGVESQQPHFDVTIEAGDLAQVPHIGHLQHAAELLRETSTPQVLEFPSSGSLMSPVWTEADLDSLVATCQWIYSLANPTRQAHLDGNEEDDDAVMDDASTRPRRILIHCADGYTESSLLALLYFMYAEGAPVHETWLRLHCEKQRNFFAYPSDVALLTSIQQRLLERSPNRQVSRPVVEPNWLSRIDGSLPSRILPYMYLGNLNHANNPELLWELGIRRILSVGEPIAWSSDEREKWGPDNLLYVDNVQDNGVDPLTAEFAKCLHFIETGKSEGTATLVHCRVGVSRSATICIAQVMSSLGLSFPRAYCFVRARRLNVIIQPHLRFMYELLKWDEHLQIKRNQPLRRELEWATIAREIAAMNRPYAR
ncbi:MAG: tyrosine/serine/threonine protein phosphatase pps1 [Caeruleum heppii]|nr:MAG: tyrosine/serine/threonine protein phosphatase pps1 [Caeruleum heppii]